MNLAKAIYYNALSPENVSNLVLNTLKGFESAKTRNLNYFDLFIIIPFYSYTPAQRQFKRITFTPINVFQREIERNPNIFSKFNFRYKKSKKFIKFGVLYALDNDMIQIDNDMNITINKRFKSNNKTIFNMGKVFSTKSTTSLYNFFEVDINVI